MNEKLAIVLTELGADGIQAFYVYLALEYIGLFTILGLITWGVRTVWKQKKGDL